MATYIIGDVHGCFAELQALLNIINFDSTKDRLGFVGDLVNRGPDSLNTLRFIKSLNNPIVVLGNHDFHVLALASHDAKFAGDHTLDAVLNAPDRVELIHWLKSQPLIYYDQDQEFVVVHAGIPPQWSFIQALDYAAEVEVQLLADDANNFLQHIHGDHPEEWNEELQGFARWRYIINAFTRIRFCDINGRLDLINKTNRSQMANTSPWFTYYHFPHRILFGHWAALGGYCPQSRCEALDTGCAWGGGLTAYRIEDRRRFYMPAIKS